MILELSLTSLLPQPPHTIFRQLASLVYTSFYLPWLPLLKFPRSLCTWRRPCHSQPPSLSSHSWFSFLYLRLLPRQEAANSPHCSRKGSCGLAYPSQCDSTPWPFSLVHCGHRALLKPMRLERTSTEDFGTNASLPF